MLQGVHESGLEAERERWEAGEQSRAEQQAAVAVLGRASRSIAMAELLKEAAQTVCRVLRCDVGGVLKLAPGREQLRLAAASGALDDEAVQTLRVPTGSASHAGWTLLRRETLACADLASEPRFGKDDPFRQLGMSSGIAVPIEGAVGRFGVLVAYARRKRRYTDDEIHFLQGVGTVLAAAFARETAQRLDRDLQIARRLDSVGKMAGGIAHDFNNLLGVILNYSQFALDELDPESQAHRDISEAVSAAERAADLTRQLLMFSRHDPAAPEVLDVNGLLENMEGLLRRTLGAHIKLCLSLGEARPRVAINGPQFERVIINLAVNARDAMSTGGTLTVETSELELTEALAGAPDELPPGRYMRLAVSDTGHGMPREVAELAFEPFFTTKERGRGTGLGLASVHGLVSSSGGHIRIYSEVGIGTTIRIYLPAVAQEPAAAEELVVTAPHGDGQRVLLVDDQQALLTLAERILVTGGYRVITASDGREALKAMEAEGEPVDLVVSDVVMPGMSGAELAEAIRARRPELPILLTSGYTGDVLLQQGLSRNEIPLVEKPFTSAELLRSVYGVLHAKAEVNR